MIDLWHITDIDWLRDISAEHAEQLRRSASLKSVAPGDPVFGPDPRPKDVFVLESGLIRLFRQSPDADEVTFGYVKPGEIFGESTLFSDKPRESQAVAVEASTALVLDRDTFRAIMKQNPPICCSLVRQIDGRFREIEARVEDLVFRNARSRLARMLLQLAEQFGRDQAGEIVLPLQLTHRDLATLIGASRPTVSLAMTELESSKLIGKQGRRICIADTGRLEQAVDQL